LVLITAALVMAAMMAMAAPAFAEPGHDITNGRNAHTDLSYPDNPYASGYAEPHGNTYVYTYQGPSSPPGSDAAGGNPGYTGGTCHGPHC
jgi:hypothetical protein